MRADPFYRREPNHLTERQQEIQAEHGYAKAQAIAKETYILFESLLWCPSGACLPMARSNEATNAETLKIVSLLGGEIWPSISE